MQLHAWCMLFVAVIALLGKQTLLCSGEQVSAHASALRSNYPSPLSLCGENLTKETGILNDLFYVFYESSTTQAQGDNVPVILWLSGGPGCSGLVALLFENGPCSFDDEADTLSFNPYSWTGLAHVIYIDQPKGTGYSGTTVPPWSLAGAVDDMHIFLQEFFRLHDELRANDFYIFGESFAGHYVPGLAVAVITSGGGLPNLKGVGIGNGVVSTTAWVDSVIPFSRDNDYGMDLLGSNAGLVQTFMDRFKSTLASCSLDPGFLRQGSNDACDQAIQALTALDSQSSKAVCAQLGRNVYDFRRLCHTDDPLGLCYRFARLQDLVNSAEVSAYFGETPHSWKLCASGAVQNLAGMDKMSESEALVAQVLERGVRVLVYGGAADTVVNWMSQDSWTSNLDWSHSAAFRSAPFTEQTFEGRRVGGVRTAHGLSFMKVYDAGHMVPHDQPAVAYEMVRSFLNDVPGVCLFS